jgi:hypothetical protein
MTCGAVSKLGDFIESHDSSAPNGLCVRGPTSIVSAHYTSFYCLSLKKKSRPRRPSPIAIVIQGEAPARPRRRTLPRRPICPLPRRPTPDNARRPWACRLPVFLLLSSPVMASRGGHSGIGGEPWPSSDCALLFVLRCHERPIHNSSARLLGFGYPRP